MGSIDQIKARMGFGPAFSDENPVIEPLALEAARNLRLPWLSHFNPHTLARHLEQHPRLSLWVPKTGEYAIGEAWRNRAEIMNVVEVTARRGKQALVRESMSVARARNFGLILLSDETWRDQTRLYQDLGFGRVETIVFFRKHLRKEEALPDPSEFPQLEYRLVSPGDLDPILRVDRASFPWLWWNSYRELEQYMQLPGVFVYAAEQKGDTIGYASFTMYHGWAHLDRLAVAWQHQGKRYGAAQLAHALRLMQNRGAESVALSTQETNLQSHRLYKGFGFRQTSDKMHFYGALLDPRIDLQYVQGA